MEEAEDWGFDGLSGARCRCCFRTGAAMKCQVGLWSLEATRCRVCRGELTQGFSLLIVAL